jgi:hypothetical protein
MPVLLDVMPWGLVDVYRHLGAVCLLHDHEYSGKTFLPDVAKHLPDHAASYPKSIFHMVSVHDLVNSAGVDSAHVLA